MGGGGGWRNKFCEFDKQVFPNFDDLNWGPCAPEAKIVTTALQSPIMYKIKYNKAIWRNSSKISKVVWQHRSEFSSLQIYYLSYKIATLYVLAFNLNEMQLSIITCFVQYLNKIFQELNSPFNDEVHHKLYHNDG